MAVQTGIVDGSNNAFLAPDGISMIVSVGITPPTPPVVSTGTYRFLEDHYINDQIIPAGTIQTMFGWLPTPNVDPLDSTALTNFYAKGPVLPGPFPTQAVPVTYWKQIAPNVWALQGLGINLAPITLPGVTRP